MTVLACIILVLCTPSRGCGSRVGTSSTDMEALRAYEECMNGIEHRPDGQHGAGGGGGERVANPRQGMPICRNGCPYTVYNLRRRFIFNGLPEYCRVQYATPHGVVGNAASPTATDMEALRACGLTGLRERVVPPHVTDMEVLRAWARCGNEPVAASMLPISIYVMPNTNRRTPLD